MLTGNNCFYLFKKENEWVLCRGLDDTGQIIDKGTEQELRNLCAHKYPKVPVISRIIHEDK